MNAQYLHKYNEIAMAIAWLVAYSEVELLLCWIIVDSHWKRSAAPVENKK